MDREITLKRKRNLQVHLREHTLGKKYLFVVSMTAVLDPHHMVGLDNKV